MGAKKRINELEKAEVDKDRKIKELEQRLLMLESVGTTSTNVESAIKNIELEAVEKTPASIRMKQQRLLTVIRLNINHHHGQIRLQIWKMLKHSTI